MANLPFVQYAFPPSLGGIIPSSITSAMWRRMPDRLLDVVNVKDFGAKGDNFSGAGGTDDRAAIQSAMDYAANNRNGAVVFFPTGNYYVSSKLIPLGSTNLHLMGSGGMATGTGSRIWTDQRDYVLYVPHGPAGTGGTVNAIRSISHLSFQNIYGGSNEANYNATAAATSIEPKATIGYTDGTPGPSGTEGHGCLYLGNVYRGTFVQMNVDFGTGLGIVVASGFDMFFVNCDIHGGFNPDSTNSAMFANYFKSIGLWHRSGYFGCARIDNCATSIVVTDGPVDLHMLDIENQGNGIVYGSKPFYHFDPELLSVRPPDDSARCQISSTRSVGIEKVTNYAYWLKLAVSNNVFLGCHAAAGGLGLEQGKVGVQIDTGNNCLFQGLDIYGFPTGIDARGASGCTFRNAATNIASGPAPWLVKTSYPLDAVPPLVYQAYPNGSGVGNIHEFGSNDGAVTVSQLPTYGNSVGAEFWVTDCLYATWANGISNIGRPVTGFATTIAGSATNATTMAFATGANNPPFIFLENGATQPWSIAGTNNPFELQLGWGLKTHNANPSTGIVTTDSLPSGVTNGSIINFVAGGGSNKVKVRWHPAATAPFGYWAIAG